MAAAVSVLVSNAAGLSDRRLMRRMAFQAITYAGPGHFGFGRFHFFRPEIIRQFTRDPAVISTAVSLIVPLVLYQYCDATQINFRQRSARHFEGDADGVDRFCSYVVVGMPVTYLMAFTAYNGYLRQYC